MEILESECEDVILFTIDENGLLVESSEEQNVPDGISIADDSNWNDESTEALLLYYLDNVNIFKGASQEDITDKWETLATMLSQSPESCQAQFERLQNMYLETARSQLEEDGKILNVANINWPYFDIFVKICQYDSGTEDARIKSTYDVQKVNLDLLQYYLKHKRLFNAAQFGGKIRLWSLLAKDLGMTAEQCANRFTIIKYKYDNLVQKLRSVNLANTGSLYNQPYYRLCADAFSPNGAENVKEHSTHTEKEKVVDCKKYKRQLRWQHNEIKKLLDYYTDNFKSFETHLYPKELWQPMTKVLDKTAVDCYKKIVELKKKYQHYCDLKQKKPNIKVGWRYYKIFEELYRKNKVPQEEFNVGDEQEDFEQCQDYILDEDCSDIVNDPSVDDASTSLTEVTETGEVFKTPSLIDEDYVCIIVGPPKTEQSTKNNQVFKKSENLSFSSDNQSRNNADQVPIKTQGKIAKWTKKSRAVLLRKYKNYLMQNKRKRINETELWIIIGRYTRRSPQSCHDEFHRLKTKYNLLRQVQSSEEISWPHFKIFAAIGLQRPMFISEKIGTSTFASENANVDGIIEEQEQEFQDLSMKEVTVRKMLSYYLEHVEEFVSPKYNKVYVWAEMGEKIGETGVNCKQKYQYLNHTYSKFKSNNNTKIDTWPYFNMFELINAKEKDVRKSIENYPILKDVKETGELVGFDAWDDMETEKLLEWFLSKVHLFRDPKNVQKYLWWEAELTLGQSSGRIAKKIRDLRSTYRSHLKSIMNGSKYSSDWKYFEICSKIYGTDLEDPLLARTKRTQKESIDSFITDHHSLLTPREPVKPPKKRRFNKKVMSQAILERLITYYVNNYERLFENSSRPKKETWREFAADIGFTGLACHKKIQLLRRQYTQLSNNKDKSLLANWPYRRMMERLFDAEDRAGS